MTDIEEQLRAIASYPVTFPPGSARAAWEGGQRRRRHRLATRTGAPVAVCAVVVAGLVTLGRSQTAQPTQIEAQTLPTASQQGSASDRSWTTKYPNGDDCVDEHACLDLGLDGVALPDPAPGFPVRVRADSTLPIGFGEGRGVSLTRRFTVAAKPERTAADGRSVPTGPEATIEIARDGAFATANDHNNMIDGHPIGDGLSALGVNAHVTNLGPGVDMLTLSTGGFDVRIVGSANVNGKTAPLAETSLVALADSLTHVRALSPSAPSPTVEPPTPRLPAVLASVGCPCHSDQDPSGGPYALASTSPTSPAPVH